MQTGDWIAIIIIGILSSIILAIAILFLTGHGAALLAGYNTLPKEEKEQYNKKPLLRFMGGILLPIGLFLPCVVIGVIFDIWWLSLIYGILVVGLIIFAVVYCNTGKRFKK